MCFVNGRAPNSPHSQGLQGSHLNLSQTSAQRHLTYFLLNNKAVKRIIFNFAKEVSSPSAVDRTDYGTASGSARGFAQHHSQQLSRAAVCGDAQNINNAARNMRGAHSFMTGLNVPPPCARAF